MRPDLDRRFEAAVLWSADPTSVAPAATALRALGEHGALVGVIAPLTVDELAARLAWPTTGAADLLLADSRGSGGVVIDEDGVHPMATPTGTVAVTLSDHEDVVIGMLEELWRRGVDPRETLLLIIGLPAVAEHRASVPFPGSDETPRPFGASRGSPRAAVVSVAAESADLDQLLADQLRCRRQRALPEALTRAGWSLVVSGFDPKHERVHEALLTLADGHTGTSGAPLGPNPGRYPWVVAAGVYDGNGPDTHLLTGPRIFELAGAAASYWTVGARPRSPYRGPPRAGGHRGGIAESAALRVAGRPGHLCPAGPVSEGPSNGATPPGAGGRLLPRPGPLGRRPLDSGCRLERRDRGRRHTSPHARSRAAAPSTVSPSTGPMPMSFPDPTPVVDALDRVRATGFDRLLARASSGMGPAMGGRRRRRGRR